MTRGRSGIATLVALLATIAAGACRDDRVTLAVARDGGAGSGGSAGGPGVAGAGGSAGGGGSDTGGIDAGAGAGTGVAGAGVAGASGAGTGGAGAGCVTDGGLGGAPERNDTAAGMWVARSPCVIPSGVPERRGFTTVAFDADRRKLLLYGEQGMTDLWELDVATATWTSRNNCGATVTPPPWEPDGITLPPQVVYDRARRRLLLFSGREGVVWEWDPDSAVWTMRAPAAGAAAPTGALPAVVYDETRGKVLVFGFEFLSNAPYANVSLWEWDGGTGAWLERIPDGLPWLSTELPALAFDAGRGAVWMFGGSQMDFDDRLWRLDTASWTLTDLTPVVRPAAWPPGRAAARMTYDPVRGRLVLFGGVRQGQQRDLWELDPATMTWRDRTSPNVANVEPAPAGVRWPASTFSTGIFPDVASGRIVQIAGDSYPDGLLDPVLWSWDGGAGSWSASAPVKSRWPHVFGWRLPVWDAGRGKLVVYDSDTRDLWQWGAGSGRWDHLKPDSVDVFYTNRDPVPWPLPRTSTAVAWDPVARRLVIFGGYNSNGLALGDLWIWDPSCGQMTSPPRPSAGWPMPRADHAMAYDPERGRVLLFGGSVPEASGELWALDTIQARWERVTPAGDWPPARTGHLLVLDEDRQVLVLHGGRAGAGRGPLFDTWELAAGASAWLQRSPGGTQLRFLAGSPRRADYVRGLGVVVTGLKEEADTTLSFALWKWDPAVAAWVGAGFDLPRPLAFDGRDPATAGAGDSLFMLLPGGPSRPAYERDFVEVWQWRAP